MPYAGYEIVESDRLALFNRFPPMFPDFIGHHITWEFGVKKDSQLPPADVTIEVAGRAYGFLPVECLLVTVTRSDGESTMHGPDGRRLHLTWSIDRARGAKPMDSNKAIEFGTIDLIIPTISLQVVPKIFL